jgi:hypothetical protein
MISYECQKKKFYSLKKKLLLQLPKTVIPLFIINFDEDSADL